MKEYPQCKFKWWYCIIYGLTQVLSGFLMVITLGYISPNWSLKLAMWAATKRIYRK